MSFSDIFKNSFLEQFSGTLSMKVIILTITIALLFSIIVFFTYKYTSKGVVYSKEFNITTSLMSVVTAAVVLSMQANIVVSLGMVGALSIVRFRTAIKEPKDLLFLFWSISNGIIIGAGIYMIALVLSILLPIGLIVFDTFPERRIPFLLVLNIQDYNFETEKRIEDILIDSSKTKYKIKSRNCSSKRIDIIYELMTKDEKNIFVRICDLPGITHVNLISQDGEGQF